MLNEIKIGMSVRVIDNAGYCAPYYGQWGTIVDVIGNETGVLLATSKRAWFYAEELEEYAPTEQEVVNFNRHQWAMKYL